MTQTLLRSAVDVTLPAERLFSHVRNTPGLKEELVALSRRENRSEAESAVRCTLIGAALFLRLAFTSGELDRLCLQTMRHRHSEVAACLRWADSSEAGRVKDLHRDAHLLGHLHLLAVRGGPPEAVWYVTCGYALACGVPRTMRAGAALQGVAFHGEHPQPRDPWRVQQEPKPHHPLRSPLNRG